MISPSRCEEGNPNPEDIRECHPPPQEAVDPPPDNPAALALTRELLDRRSRRYRNLVAAVALIGLAVPVAALVFWRWDIILGWLLVVPVAGTALALVLQRREPAQPWGSFPS